MFGEVNILPLYWQISKMVYVNFVYCGYIWVCNSLCVSNSVEIWTVHCWVCCFDVPMAVCKKFVEYLSVLQIFLYQFWILIGKGLIVCVSLMCLLLFFGRGFVCCWLWSEWKTVLRYEFIRAWWLHLVLKYVAQYN